MQLSPRYGDEPIITLDGDPAAIAVPAVRQRRRLVEILRTFTADQWAHDTRCAAWTARDVIVHLDSTNRFWTASIAAGVQGQPTRYLAGFDPVESPAQMVAATATGHDEVFASFAASTEEFAALLESLPGEAFTVTAEAPPGHLSVSAVAHHALWDSWVHERDIVVPQGIDPVVEADEVAACLRYAAALGPAFGLSVGSTQRGSLGVDVRDPGATFTVRVGDRVDVVGGAEPTELTLHGDAVALLEALSVRVPLQQDVDPSARWLLSGLTTVFDQTTD